MKIKLEGYDKEFGIGITIRKLPMLFEFKYRIIIHVTWLQVCILIKSPWNK